MNILLLGSDRLLGMELDRVLRESGQHTVEAILAENVEINRPTEVRDLTRGRDLVINLIEHDDLEAAEADRRPTYRMNIDGARNLAYQCAKTGAKILHLSSAYVFDGSKSSKYTERDIPNPINIYGSSKLMAEKDIRAEGGDYLIIRTMALFGRKQHPGHFLSDLIERVRSEGETVRVIDNQLVAPSFVGHVAEAVASLIDLGRNGIVHVGPSDACSWYEFGQAVLSELGLNPLRIEPCHAEQMGLRAARPPNLVLDNHWYLNWTGRDFPSWREGLRAAIA